MIESSRWKHRHTALAIVFTIWIVSYLDRMVIATALPYIAKEFALSPAAMGVVLSAFFAGYALFQIPGGILSDRYGARNVLVWAILWWSALTAVTGAAMNLTQMIIIRVLFGVGEGVAPAATWKALANWTSARDRAFANAIMMSSNALGPALAPLFVVAIIAAWGWRTVFYVLFIPGLLLATWVWCKLPDNPADKKGITREELDELTDIKPVSPGLAARDMTFWQVIVVPAVWKSFLILFFSNMGTWGFTSWIPSYLVQARGLSLSSLGLAASAPFFAGTVSMVFAGWIVARRFRHMPQMAYIVFAVPGAICLYLMYTVSDLRFMLLLNTLTGFFILGATAVVFGLPMASVPKDITGRAMGIVNTAGQLAGFLAPMIVGFLVVSKEDGTRDFSMGFGFLCCSLLVASFIALFFKPRKEDIYK